MADVVNLSGKPVDVAVPYDGGLVDILERAIASVKTGEVHSVAVVLARLNDAHRIELDTSYQGRRLELIAGVSRVMHRLHVEMDEANDAQQDT